MTARDQLPLSQKRLGKYPEDDLPEFTPMSWTLKEIRDTIPPHLFVRHTTQGLLYLARDLFMVAALWNIAMLIDPFFTKSNTVELLTPVGAQLARWASWGIYFWFQGLVFTGLWVIGHECGHEAFSPHKIVNDTIGFILQTLL